MHVLRRFGRSATLIALLHGWLGCDDPTRDGSRDAPALADAAQSGLDSGSIPGATADASAMMPGEAGHAPLGDAGSTRDAMATLPGAGGRPRDAASSETGTSDADVTSDASTEPAVSKERETQIARSGLTIVSYGGYLNGESFQQDAIVTHRGYQYTAYWNSNRHVVLARRLLPDGAWSSFEFTDYRNTEDDSHNTISLGVSAGDGTLHIAFDHHSTDLHYRKSVAGLLSAPESATWAARSFSAVTGALVGSRTIALVTYPRFVSQPAGGKLLLSARIGTSGSGDEQLWEYDSATGSWSELGKYIDGIRDSVNAYLHGVAYTRGGARLHISWCWRETPDATTNHDLFYAYSDDHGRSWKSNSGVTIATTGTSFISKNTASAKVWTIGQNRGLINQEHMTVDASGVVHVLLSHMPDTRPDDANFTSARTKTQYFHYFRAGDGTWTRRALNLPVIENLRGKLAVSSTRNVYAVLPDMRIAAASAAASYGDWKLLDASATGRFFSDPLIDTARLESEDKLTIFYPQKSSPNIFALDYALR